MINLNDEKYADKGVKIFNGGKAGAANGCTMTVVRKADTDPDNAPLYKIILTDVSGAEINKGYVFANFDNSSEKQLDFLVRECKHLINLVGGKQLDQVESYRALVDYAMKTVRENAVGKKFNVAVSYGTTDYPKRFLEISSALAIVKDTEAAYINPKYIMVRPEPTEQAQQTGGTAAGGEDNSGW